MSSSIKITSNPFPKEEKSEEWIGVKIPLSWDEEHYCLRNDAVFVDAWRAITALGKKSLEAGIWWTAKTHFAGTQFIFRKENYEIITQLELAL
jgi:hypothetical protein